MNTHWHSGHVGGNALLQAAGAGIAASSPDADTVARRDPGCCLASTSTSPSRRTPSTSRSTTGSSCGSATPTGRWVRMPGDTPGHLSLWQPEERLLVVGDALSSQDVGWVKPRP